MNRVVVLRETPYNSKEVFLAGDVYGTCLIPNRQEVKKFIDSFLRKEGSASYDSIEDVLNRFISYLQDMESFIEEPENWIEVKKEKHIEIGSRFDILDL